MNDNTQPVGSNLYACRLISVRAADDLKMQIELGMAGISITRRVRLDGVMLYERLSQAEGDILTTEIRTLLQGRCLTIRVTKELTSECVRATVYYRNMEGELVSLNDYLVSKGYANSNGE